MHSLERVKRKVCEVLTDIHIMENLPDGRMVIDTEALLDGRFQAHFRKNGKITAQAEPYMRKSGNAVSSLLATTFESTPVISRADYDEELRTGIPAQPRTLMYDPHTPEEAFTIGTIKNSDFHVAGWEFGQNYSTSPFTAPQKEGDANFFETSIAALLYHPKYGNGHRDPKGKLQVWWPSKKAFRPISADWFREFRAFGSYNLDSASITGSPLVFLRTNAPELLRRGLIRSSDFVVTAGSESYERQRFRRPIRRGVVMIEGISYFIGKTKEFENAEVVILMPGIAGIITQDSLSKYPTLTYTFALLRRDNPDLTLWKQGKNTYGYAGKGTFEMKPFQAEEYIIRKSEESDDAYALRVRRSIQDINFLLQFSDRISTETGVNIAKLKFGEQNIIADSVREQKEKPERMIKFIETFKLPGLRTFLALEEDKSLGRDILAYGEQNPDAAKEVFSKYDEILKAAMGVREKVADYFKNSRRLNNQELNSITQTLTKKAHELLARFVRSDKDLHESDVVSRLHAIQSEILVFAATFKVASAEQNLEFGDIRDVRLEMKDALELTEDERKEMERILLGNRTHHTAERRQITARNFRTAAENPGSTFYILKNNTTTIAFLRFEDLPNGNRYVGHFNVSPEIRGSAIGSALFRATIEKEGTDRDIELVVDPANPMATHYEKDFGFKNVETLEDFKGTGRHYRMVRPRFHASEQMAA